MRLRKKFLLLVRVFRNSSKSQLRCSLLKFHQAQRKSRSEGHEAKQEMSTKSSFRIRGETVWAMKLGKSQYGQLMRIIWKVIAMQGRENELFLCRVFVAR
ncbi:hypothetical protein CSQ91_09940 [Janthinobacterium sp. BJB301]|nr:hypothetical protein CSQ91_09940 [Janthinobacterium sp. BJB301]